MAIGRKGHSWPVSYLGVLSYPLYLLHQDIGLIVIALAEPHLGLVGAAALALLSALALAAIVQWAIDLWRSEEHTSELQSLMRISYAVFCLKKQKTTINTRTS